MLACIAWGTACLFVSELAGYGFHSFEIAAGRCIAAAICLFAYMLIKHKKAVKITLRQLITVAIQGTSFFAMAATYFYAMRHTSNSTASMLLSSAPVIVTVVSVLFLGEKMTVKKLSAIAISLVGCGLVVGIVSGFAFSLFGILMGVLGTLFYAAYSLCTKIAMRQGMETDVNITYSFCFSALAALVTANPVSLFPHIMTSEPTAILLIVAIGIVTGAFAGLLFTNGMKRLPAGIASPLGVIEPIVTTLLSVIFLQERLDVFKVVGIILVLLAVFMLSTEKSTDQQRYSCNSCCKTMCRRRNRNEKA